MTDRIPNTNVNLPAAGSFSPAPAGAPHEVSDKTVPADVAYVGADGTVVSAVQMARANERDLPAYAPKPMTDEQMASYLGKSIEEVRALRAATGAAAPPAPTAPATQPTLIPVLPPAPLPTPAIEPSTLIPQVLVDPSGKPITSSIKGVDAPLPSQDPNGLRAAARAIHPAGQASTRPDPDAPYYPAASNTDSPSRGIPTATLDKGKQITGGFGDLGEAQYFPLDGLELKTRVEKLYDDGRARIQDDLRFSIAATYPRVRARLVLEVECYAADHSFQIEKIMLPPHEKTPIEVARQHGDRVVFCVVEQHLEMTEDGESVTPPNAARMELGLPVPRKHVVQLPGKQRMLVDV